MSSDALDVRVEHELFVRSFFGMSPPLRVTQQITARLKDRWYEPGEVIYEEGTPPRWMYFVVSGEISLSDDDDEAWRFGQMSLVGVMDANLGRPHARTARARGSVHALALQSDDFYDILEDNFDFTREMIQSACLGTWSQSLTLPPDDILPPAARRKAVQPWLSVRRLNEVQRLMVLHDSDLTDGGPVQPLVTLAGSCREKRFVRGQTVLRAGSELDALWVLADGLLSVDSDLRSPMASGERRAPGRRWQPEGRQSQTVRGSFEPGNLVLGLAGLPAEVSPYEVVAARDSVLLGVPREALWDMMEDHFGLARRVLAYVARENERIRARRSDLKLSRDLSEGVD